ncbi:MAG: prolipoprotein diacylglyceryl transferase [Eubacteriales bacterium]|nr:prolipoprotein diacylglyceryl transferase [Clostridia bacterium]MDD4422911.1 prolipoprotein diacylglyceryl transferase [Eubacteriales bacterium]
MLFAVKDPYIAIGGLKIYYYAICIVLGMCVAIFLAVKLFKKMGYDGDDVYVYAIAIIPIGVLCARLYFFIFPYEDSVHDWSRFFHFKDGGLAIYGGIIGGLITTVLTAFIKKQNIFRVLDSFMPGAMIAQAMGRWGNFFNEEAFGNLVTNPKLQFFPYSVYISNLDGYYQATFFYESLWNVIGVVALLLLIYKWQKYRVGTTTGGYFVWYGLGRFWIEALRADSLVIPNTTIKVSQVVSVGLIIIGLLVLMFTYSKKVLHDGFRNRTFPVLATIEPFVANKKTSGQATDDCAVASVREADTDKQDNTSNSLTVPKEDDNPTANTDERAEVCDDVTASKEVNNTFCNVAENDTSDESERK